MKMWYFLEDENGYLSVKSSTSMRNENEISVVIPDDHPIHTDNFMTYRYENGELIKDEAYHQRLIEEEQYDQSKPSDDELNAIAVMELTEMLLGGG